MNGLRESADPDYAATRLRVSERSTEKGSGFRPAAP